jgi:hypothetical protein
LKIPPEPPPRGENNRIRKAVGKRSREKGAGRRKKGDKVGMRSRVDPPETGGNVLQDAEKGGTPPGGTATVQMRNITRISTPAKETRWPAPPGLIMDIQRAASPRSVVEILQTDKSVREHKNTGACKIRAVNIAQDAAIVVRRVEENGVLSDSGANSCMAHNEHHLVRCHDITPVSVGLALSSDEEPIMYECRRMGYMPMTREDGRVHMQPFLVNTHATDCILSPDAIARQSRDCVTWRQEGHVGQEPGTLEFFNEKGNRIMRLHLVKTNGLYYADVNDVRAPRLEECAVYSMLTDDWIQVLDAGHGEKEVTDAWARIAKVVQSPSKTTKVKTRQPEERKRLPTLPENGAFDPLVDPIEGRDTPHELTPTSPKTAARRTKRATHTPAAPTVTQPDAIVEDDETKEQDNQLT